MRERNISLSTRKNDRSLRIRTSRPRENYSYRPTKRENYSRSVGPFGENISKACIYQIETRERGPTLVKGDTLRRAAISISFYCFAATDRTFGYLEISDSADQSLRRRSIDVTYFAFRRTRPVRPRPVRPTATWFGRNSRRARADSQNRCRHREFHSCMALQDGLSYTGVSV